MHRKRTSALQALQLDEHVPQRAEERATTVRISLESEQPGKSEEGPQKDVLVDVSIKQQSLALFATILVNALTLGTCKSFSPLVPY